MVNLDASGPIPRQNDFENIWTIKGWFGQISGAISEMKML